MHFLQSPGRPAHSERDLPMPGTYEKTAVHSGLYEPRFHLPRFFSKKISADNRLDNNYGSLSLRK
jgi:hypothetical protein